MATQPISFSHKLITPRQQTLILLSLAASFVFTGAIVLGLTRPLPSLQSYHLILLVTGWTLAWGGSYLYLQRYLAESEPFILPVVAMLTGWGLLLQARLAPNFLLRQIVWLILGNIVLCLTTTYSTLPRLLRRYRYTLLAAGLLLLATTFTLGVNPSGYGQQLWLGAWGVYFQPSELLKLLLVIYLAAYLSERREIVQSRNGQISLWLSVLGPMLLMFGLALLLLGWQQDLGAALLFYLTFLAMLYLAWGQSYHVILGLLGFAPIAIIGYQLSARVALRADIWLNPWLPERADEAFQILQSLFALAAGGVIGEGLGQGRPTLIPVVHSDFVYSALVEEFGLIGGIACLVLIGLLIHRSITLAQRAESPFESLLAGGIAALLGIQTWVIIAGITKLMPLTGVTLPFLSYGGSSLLVAMVEIGLLLNIAGPHPPTLSLKLGINQIPALKKTASNLGKTLFLLLGTLALSTGTWSVWRSTELRESTRNPRYILEEARIHRGRILGRGDTVLADIEIDEDGFVERTYPVPEAAPVLGYATLQYGTAGIEATCDTALRGAARRTTSEILWDELNHRDPVGQSIRLTLDAELQRTAQQFLTGTLGAVVLVDAHNGNLLALASSPTYNPETVTEDWADLRTATQSPLLNRATQSLAQPGSALQTLVLATALEKTNPLTPPTALTNSVPVNGLNLTCRNIPAAQTWKAALTNNCPAPFATLGDELGITNLAQSFHNWGITTAPLFEIETTASPWDEETADASLEAIGQGSLLVTPLQMAGIAATLGNNGKRPPIHLLTEDTTGCEIPPHLEPVSVIAPETAQALLQRWDNWGKSIGHLSYALAGEGRTLVWFLGLNSLEAPRYAIAVLIENPADFEQAAQIGDALLQMAVGP